MDQAGNKMSRGKRKDYELEIKFCPLALAAPFIFPVTLYVPPSLLCLLFTPVIIYFPLSHFIFTLMHLMLPFSTCCTFYFSP